MAHRVENTKNMPVHFNTEVDKVLGGKEMEGLRMINNVTGKKEEIVITGLYIAIDHKPNRDNFKDQLNFDETGYLITAGKSTKTNFPEVFASGDVQGKEYLPALTAVKTGCMTALDAKRYFATLEEYIYGFYKKNRRSFQIAYFFM